VVRRCGLGTRAAEHEACLRPQFGLEAKARDLAGIKGYVTDLQACPNGERSLRMSKSDLRARPIYHRKRDSVEAHLTIVSAALAVSRWIEAWTGWSIGEFVRTARRYRTVEILAGPPPSPPRIPCPTTSAESSKPSAAPADFRTNLAQLGQQDDLPSSEMARLTPTHAANRFGWLCSPMLPD
jgi:hypothetical protein